MLGINFCEAKNGDTYLKIVARNGRTLMSGEIYESGVSGAVKGANAVVDAVKAEHFQIRTAKNGEPYFVLLAKNHQVLMVSETYKSGMSGVKRGIAATIKSINESQ